MGIDLDGMLTGARDALTVKRVFGDAYEVDGVTVIPVARLAGGSGGGGSEQGDGGGGFGLAAAPAGVYVVDGGRVRWQPAVDVNRLVAAAAAVLVAAITTRRSVARARAAARGR